MDSLKLKDGRKIQLATTVGRHSTNNKTEAKYLITAAIPSDRYIATLRKMSSLLTQAFLHKVSEGLV